MKTSKIILISFFSLVGLFMLSLLIQVDMRHPEPYFNEAAIALPAFNHLVLINSGKVNVFQAGGDSAKMNYDLHTEAEMPGFELKTDTLVLRWPSKQNTWDRSIHCSALKTVRVENSQLNIKEFNGDSLRVYAHSGDVYVNNIANNAYVSLDLTAKSFVKINGVQVGRVDANFSFSKAKLHIEQLGELNAVLADSSHLYSRKVLHSNVRADNSSRFFAD